MGNAQAQGPPPPPPKAWEKSAWYGMLMDPYVEGMEVPCDVAGSSGQLSSLLKVLVKDAANRLPGVPPALLQVLKDLSKKLKQCSSFAAKAKKMKDDEGLAQVVGELVAMLEKLRPGDYCLLPGGWKQPQNASDNYVVHIVFRPDPDPRGTLHFATCNAGDGMEYHPSSVEDKDKLRYKLSMCFNDLPRDKVVDPGFLALLLTQRQPQASHCKETYYDALLSWLVDEEGATLAPLMPAVEADQAASWRTPARARTSGWKSCFEAARYVLRRKYAVPDAALKQLALALRRLCIAQATRDLRKLDDPRALLQPHLLQARMQGLTLYDHQGGTHSGATRLQGCVTALFFGGSWCQATQQFEPQLRSAYDAIKLAGHSFEAVYISMDKDEESYDQFRGPMPWLALEFGDPDGEELQDVFDVDAVPRVVILGANGTILNANATQAISQDTRGQSFPWGSAEARGGRRGRAIVDGALGTPCTGKTLGIYFAGQWCSKSRQVTPQLAQAYQAAQRAERPFEMVYVSADTDQGQYDAFAGEMPWRALPWQHDAAAELRRLFSVTGTPRLVLIAADGAMINPSAHDQVARDSNAEAYPWPADSSEAPQGLSSDDRTRVRIGCRQVARSALKEHARGRLSDAELAVVEGELEGASQLADKLQQRWDSQAGRPSALPPRCDATRTVADRDHAMFELLKQTGEDEYRGAAAAIHEPPLADLLAVPGRDEIGSPAQAFNAMEACLRAVQDLVARAATDADAAFSSSRVAVHQQAIALIQDLFTRGIPLPRPIESGQRAGCLWDQGMSAADQTRGMKVIYELLFKLATLWQDVERSTRQADSERALAAACCFAMFDRVARTIAHGSPSLPSRLLSGPGGGYQLHTGVDDRGRARFEELSKYLELDAPELCRSRAACVGYFRSIQRLGLDPLFRVGVASVGNIMTKKETIALRALTFDINDPTMRFVQQLVIQSGLRPEPPQARQMCQFPVEFVAEYLMANPGDEGPFAKLPQREPQWPLIRDTCILFKFVYSLLPRVDEAMMFRQRSLRHVQQIPLSHTPPAMGSRGRGRMDRIEWQKHRTHGAMKEKVDLMTRSFDSRVLVWGQGPTIFSPANPKWLMRNDPDIPKSWYVTEDDVLHASARSLEAVRYQQTLSVEEAHRMLTYLVAPYMRMPLIAHFFADLQRDPSAGGALRAGNRVTYLFTEKLQELFSAVLFEAGDYVEDDGESAITRVPCRRSRSEQDKYLKALRTDARLEKGGSEVTMLGAQHGLLENELRHSPESVMQPVIELVRYAVDELCSREQLHTDAAGYVLFISACAATFELHCRDFLHRSAQDAGLDASEAAAREALRHHTEELGQLLRGRIMSCLDVWVEVARAEVGHDHGWGSLTQNLPTLSVLHAYKALLQLPLICSGGRADQNAVRIFLGCMGYVRAHHTYGQLLKIKALSASQQADKDAMERMLCELLDRFLQSMGFGVDVDARGQQERDVSGLRKWVASDQQVWFTGVAGDQCIRVPLPARGRRSRGFKAPPAEVPEQALAAAMTRSRRHIVGFLDHLPPEDLSRVLCDVAITALGGEHELDSAQQWRPSDERRGLYRLGSDLTVDAQTGEVLFGGRRIVPVPDDFAEFADFQDLFGRDSLQCYFSHVHENRTWINLVGLRYDLMRWTEPPVEEQGVGEPKPVPKKAFRYPPVEVVEMLNQVPVVDRQGRRDIVGNAVAGKAYVAWYFHSNGCPHCGTFAPMLAQLYAQRQDFQVIMVSTDQQQQAFRTALGSQPWPAVDHGTEEHQEVVRFFAPQGVPHLVIMTADGDFRLATNDGAASLRQHPDGAGFPWGDPPPPRDPDEQEGIFYNGDYYARPFSWYYPKEDPPPTPEPTEQWVVDILQPVLEASYKQPHDAMDHVLYLPEQPLTEGEERCILVGMVKEGKQDATWREVEVLKQWGTVIMYNLESHGRRVYRRQVFCSRSYASLLSLPPAKTGGQGVPCLIAAAGSVKPTREPERTLVIKRWNDGLGGRETLLPTRLLEGIIPGALLEDHRWWQGEDLVIRGEPKNPGADEWFPYYLELHIIDPRPDADDPEWIGRTGAIIVKRHSKEEMTPISQHQAARRFRGDAADGGAMTLRAKHDPGRGGGSPEGHGHSIPSACTDHEAILHLLTEQGFSLEAAQEALDQTVVGGRADYEEAMRVLHEGAAAGTTDLPRPMSHTGGTGGDMSKAHPDEIIEDARGGELLLDILRAPSGSALHRLAKIFTRIEDVGHVLVWGVPASDGSAAREIRQVELPRLHLRFDVREVHESGTRRSRIYSKDYSDWFISDLSDESIDGAELPPRLEHLRQLLEGLPQSIVLENATKELRLLMPSHPAYRVMETGEVFGTRLIFDRREDGAAWGSTFQDTRHFLYPIHASRTFLLPPGLDALLYLIMLRFYARQYDQAHRLSQSVAVDVPFTATEAWVWQQLENVEDNHPDAHALRLRLLVATRFRDGATEGAWDPSREYARFCQKRGHVSAGCQLTEEDERQAARLCVRCVGMHGMLRKQVLEHNAKHSEEAMIKPPRLIPAGHPWYAFVTASAERIRGAHQPAMFRFSWPEAEGADGPPGALDNMFFKLAFDDVFMSENEEGSTYGAGFLFLYQLMCGQIKCSLETKDCGRSLATLLGRMTQLKACNYGQGGEHVQYRVTWPQVVLKLMVDHPDAGWPELPLPWGNRPMAPVRGCSPDEFAEWINDSRQNPQHIARERRQMMDPELMQIMRQMGGRGAQELMEQMQGQEEQPVEETFRLWQEQVQRRVDSVMEKPQVQQQRERVGEAARRALGYLTRREEEGVDVGGPFREASALPPPAPADAGRSRYELRATGPEGFQLRRPAAVREGRQPTLGISAEDLGVFAHAPLADLPQLRPFVRNSPGKGMDGVAKQVLPFPIRQHPATAAAHAKGLLDALEESLNNHTENKLTAEVSELVGFGAAEQKALADPQTFHTVKAAAEQQLQRLSAALAEQYEADMKYVEQGLAAAGQWADLIPGEGAQEVAARLSRVAGQLGSVSTQLLAMAPLSTTGERDIQHVNPFVPDPGQLVALVVAVQLHANRLAQIARTRVAVDSMLGRIRAGLLVQGKEGTARERGTALGHLVSAVRSNLDGRRFSLKVQGGAGAFDPRFFSFEYMFEVMLRGRQVEMCTDLNSKLAAGDSSCQQMIMGDGKTTFIGPIMTLCQADGRTLVLQVMPSALLEQTRNVMRERFGSLLPKRVYTLTFDRSVGHSTGHAMSQDASWGAALDQLAVIREKMALARSHRGVVVAAPEAVKSCFLKMIEMLHLVEANTNPQTKGGLGGNWSTAMAHARASGGARGAQQVAHQKAELEFMSDVADSVNQVISIWQGAVMVMDEVDVLLHPLRSELNFPIGQKSQIDQFGLRWELPMQLLRLVFPEKMLRDLAYEAADHPDEMRPWYKAERRTKRTRVELARQMRAVIKEGCGSGGGEAQLMQEPHMVLMSHSFYVERMRPVFADMALIWLRYQWDIVQEDLDDKAPGLTDDIVLDYLRGGPPGVGDTVRLQPWVKGDGGVLAGGKTGKVLEVKVAQGDTHDGGIAAVDTAVIRSSTGAEGTISMWKLLKERLAGVEVSALKEATVKLLNLAAEWIQSTLPHVLTKINKVTYGLLRPEDIARQPRSAPEERQLVAVPFLAKDVPSPNSEFAHPDVLIGLTVLAYHHRLANEPGLRDNDVMEIAKQLKLEFSKEHGAKNVRKANLTFEEYKRLGRMEWRRRQLERCKRITERVYEEARSPRLADLARAPMPADPERKEDVDRWVKEVEARLKDIQGALRESLQAGERYVRDERWAREDYAAVRCEAGATEPVVGKLEQFQPEEDYQRKSLRELIGYVSRAVDQYMNTLVFPKAMLFQRLKISACGQELGSDILFRRRIGFSGTPSDLIPKDLGRCVKERGSDGKMLRVLTDRNVMSSVDVPEQWSAKSILRMISSGDHGIFHAMIDTGALVTGMENEEVAEELLRFLPQWMKGVVFLDKLDRKMILLRSSGRTLPLHQAPIPPDSRFTFYDQYHTTGTDIKQAPSVRAAVTVSKDMVFRDYAQGVWRMRQIGIGQTATVFLIPEIRGAIRADLQAADASGKQLVPGFFASDEKSGPRWELNVPAWLLLNATRMEGLQAMQLTVQELHNVFRKRALRTLQDDVERHQGATKRANRFWRQRRSSTVTTAEEATAARSVGATEKLAESYNGLQVGMDIRCQVPGGKSGRRYGATVLRVSTASVTVQFSNKDINEAEPVAIPRAEWLELEWEEMGGPHGFGPRTGSSFTPPTPDTAGSGAAAPRVFPAAPQAAAAAAPPRPPPAPAPQPPPPPQAEERGRWEWQDDSGMWTPFDPAPESQLERQFTAGSRVWNTKMRGMSYRFDFRSMEQINTGTNKRRPIRRVGGPAPSGAPPQAPQQEELPWPCEVCTYVNPQTASRCTVCDQGRRPAVLDPRLAALAPGQWLRMSPPGKSGKYKCEIKEIFANGDLSLDFTRFEPQIGVIRVAKDHLDERGFDVMETAPSDEPSAPSPSGGGGGDAPPPVAPEEEWACDVCSFLNSYASDTCEVCAVGQRPERAQPALERQQQSFTEEERAELAQLKKAQDQAAAEERLKAQREKEADMRSMLARAHQKISPSSEAFAIDSFREIVSHDLPSKQPEPKTLDGVLQSQINRYQSAFGVRECPGRWSGGSIPLGEDGAERVEEVLVTAVSRSGRAVGAEGMDSEREQQQEQEQEKKQLQRQEQQQQQEKQYNRNDEDAASWNPGRLAGAPSIEQIVEQLRMLRMQGAGGGFPFSQLVLGGESFFPLKLFQVDKDMPTVDFPDNILVSDNFFRPTWLGSGERRIKNVNAMLEWCPDGMDQRFIVIVTLEEAETIRRLIHTKTYGVRQGDMRVQKHPLTVRIALKLPNGGIVCDATHEWRTDPRKVGSGDIDGLMECVRFFDNEMFFTSAQLDALVGHLRSTDYRDRIGFFAGCLERRRRQRLAWQDTPLARAFLPEDAAVVAGSLLWRIREAIRGSIEYRKGVQRQLGKLDLMLSAHWDQWTPAKKEQVILRIQQYRETLAEYKGSYDAIFDHVAGASDEGNMCLTVGNLQDLMYLYRVEVTRGQAMAVMAEAKKEAYKKDLPPAARALQNDRLSADEFKAVMFMETPHTGEPVSCMCDKCPQIGEITPDRILRGFVKQRRLCKTCHSEVELSKENAVWQCAAASCPSRSFDVHFPPYTPTCTYCGAARGAQEWVCDGCQTVNDDSLEYCQHCSFQRRKAADEESGVRPGFWKCNICTYASNPVSVFACVMCNNAKGALPGGDSQTGATVY
eukprot:TRINITY_DN888_c0_g3_i1.p1 TRINITY_DN888_c0_g3~~TRINITY_DN888_c0_g3_i1.p1  ORF type:complete len:5328 (+),score=1998.63 TRINITY_DN888_c0_g3_i1:108-15986(+)